MNVGKILTYSIYTLGIVSALMLIVGSIFKGILHVDEPVLLVEMERIAEGYIPYKTLHLNYPPLWFYMMAGLKMLFNISYGNYTFYLIVHYCFVLCNSILIYVICRLFNISKLHSFISAWLFVVSSHWLSGNAVLFEMPSIAFGLFATWLTVKYKDSNPLLFIAIGIVTCCSLLIKQFGAGFFVLVLYLVLFLQTNHIALKTLCYLVGYTLPLVLCLIIWGNDFITSVFLNGYGSTNVSGESISMFNAANAIWVLKNIGWFILRVCPAIILILFFIPHIIQSRQLNICLYSVFGILGFSLQFLFVHWDHSALLHYFLYLLPFATIGFALVLSNSFAARHTPAAATYLRGGV